MAERKPMTANQPSEYRDQTPIRVRRGRVDSVDLYEIKDSELDLLEKGSPAGTQLNFSIFLLSIAFASIVCLATATFTQPIVKTIFVFIAVVGILLGAYLLISWLRARASISDAVKTIRSRISEERFSQPPGTSPKPPVESRDSEKPVG